MGGQTGTPGWRGGPGQPAGIVLGVWIWVGLLLLGESDNQPADKDEQVENPSAAGQVTVEDQHVGYTEAAEHCQSIARHSNMAPMRCYLRRTVANE